MEEQMLMELLLKDALHFYMQLEVGTQRWYDSYCRKELLPLDRIMLVEQFFIMPLRKAIFQF